MTKSKEKLKEKLQDMLRKTHADLARAEILAAALAAFSKPVPDYEPRFHHFGKGGPALDRFKVDR